MKTFPKELLEEAVRILDEIKHPIEQSDAIDELLEENDYESDDIVDLMHALTPTVH